MTPFIGVRISWLILARKSDFTCAAASAISFACNSSDVRSLTSDSSLLLKSMTWVFDFSNSRTIDVNDRSNVVISFFLLVPKTTLKSDSVLNLSFEIASVRIPNGRRRMRLLTHKKINQSAIPLMSAFIMRKVNPNCTLLSTTLESE